MTLRLLLIQITGMILVMTLAACQPLVAPSPTPPPIQLSWKERQLALSRIQNWQINGKVAVRTAQDSGSAIVNWIQNNKRYTVSLLGPFGSGGMNLRGQSSQVILKTADGKQYFANNPEQLLAEQWGFRVPISSLMYWIRGLPVSDLPYSKQLDEYNRLITLFQQGWQIQFLSYTTVGKIELPNKIDLSSPELKAKLVIYRWTI